MFAPAPAAGNKFSAPGKRPEWVPTRKSPAGVGRNKYLDLCMTRPAPTVQNPLSRLPVSKGCHADYVVAPGIPDRQIFSEFATAN